LTLAEEKETDEKLTELAAEINLFAAESERAETEVDSQHATSKGPRKTKARQASDRQPRNLLGNVCQATSRLSSAKNSVETDN
jgi:hypothetical protein